MFRPICLLPTIAALFGLTACSGLLKSSEPAERIYWLDPFIVRDTVVVEGARPSLALSVTTAPGLDTDRLLILGPEARLNYYAAAKWPDDNHEIIESLLRTTLESTGRYARVTAEPSTHSTDWQLELEVRELYTLVSTTDNANTVRMLLSGYVSCPVSDDTIAMQANIGIEDDRLGKIVAAYQHALHEISQQLLSQLAEACHSTDDSGSLPAKST